MTTMSVTSFDPRNVVTCARCGLRYDWRRSPSSSLKMTYCGSLCERADLGFTLESLLRMPVPAATKVVDFTKPGADVPAAAPLAA